MRNASIFVLELAFRKLKVKMQTAKLHFKIQKATCGPGEVPVPATYLLTV